jgi:hypothetical protein
VAQKCGELYFLIDMTIEKIKQILNNKINILNEQRNLAYMNGDLVEYDALETQILETQSIIDKLNA